MTNTDHCRKSLHARLGIGDERRRDPSAMSAEIRRMTDSLEALCELARPRLIMGGIRYGSEWKHEPLMKYMQAKFDEYKATGNFEMMVDFFNFIGIESVLKTHPEFHFKAKDRT